jgi:hypothetical protein
VNDGENPWVKDGENPHPPFVFSVIEKKDWQLTLLYSHGDFYSHIPQRWLSVSAKRFRNSSILLAGFGCDFEWPTFSN